MCQCFRHYFICKNFNSNNLLQIILCKLDFKSTWVKNLRGHMPPVWMGMMHLGKDDSGKDEERESVREDRGGNIIYLFSLRWKADICSPTLQRRERTGGFPQLTTPLSHTHTKSSPLLCLTLKSAPPYSQTYTVSKSGHTINIYCVFTFK